MEPLDIRLFVSDVDGTLLNSQRELTPATATAIGELQAAGIRFALVSQRPLKGLYGLMEKLKISAACAALNGGVIVDGNRVFVSEQIISSALAREVVSAVERFSLDPWIYTRDEWYVPRGDGAHVQHEAESVVVSPVPFERLSEVRGPSDNQSHRGKRQLRSGHRL
jgi:HAD superfamily hydrolase (TIGR01484 family)